MSRQFWLKLCLAAVSILVTLGVLEIGVRLLTTRDADGAPRFRVTRLKPYRLPVARVEREMAAYLSSDKTTLLYDPDLGWRPHPGMLDANAEGFRTTSPMPSRSLPYPRNPPDRALWRFIYRRNPEGRWLVAGARDNG